VPILGVCGYNCVGCDAAVLHCWGETLYASAPRKNFLAANSGSGDAGVLLRGFKAIGRKVEVGDGVERCGGGGGQWDVLGACRCDDAGWSYER
jgi:hypothetical protein